MFIQPGISCTINQVLDVHSLRLVSLRKGALCFAHQTFISENGRIKSLAGSNTTRLLLLF